MRLISDTRVFYSVMLASLAICILFYAEEAISFKRYGMDNPHNDFYASDYASCKTVPGKPKDLECPVEVYGWQRYRFVDQRRDYVIVVERIQ